METLLERYFIPFVIDVLRLTAWLVLLLTVFVPLEKLAGLHPQKFFRKAFTVDLSLYFLNSLLPKLLLTLPLAGVAWALHYLMPDELYDWVADQPLWARLAGALVIGEIGFYWGHRWAHAIPLLWRFHSLHHSAEEMDWLVNTRAHPLDIVFVRLCGIVPLYVVGLARPLDGTNVDTVPLLLMVIATAWGFFVHANLRWRLGWLSMLIATPAFHHWHHTNDERMNRNFASMLPILDKVFGTWYLPLNQWPAKYGIDVPASPEELEIQPAAAESSLSAQ